ncbi:hypothetical protein OHA70_03175 [Kribbella sp. NBC_00382]|uniref:hypothetical protein n=1 Tax=Kribbella sp. NBC_00382 TaxID=2975967 RepID=UPI002E1EB718
MVDPEFDPHPDPVPPPSWPWDPELPPGATLRRETVTNADGSTTETVTLADE